LPWEESDSEDEWGKPKKKRRKKTAGNTKEDWNSSDEEYFAALERETAEFDKEQKKVISYIGILLLYFCNC